MKKIPRLATRFEQNSRFFRILLISALIAVLFGCVESDSYYEEEGREIKSGYIINGSSFDDNACTAGECTCFVCKNSTPTDSAFFDALAAPFFDYTLEEGECSFLPCNETEFKEGFENDPNMHAYFFMIGQGSNFAEWADANPYCNNSLRMAVKWLSSREGYDYPLPNEGRARCIL
ncbi:MAG: hypothetical protein QXH30_01580, partial [Candidatus Bilamarchaeaceae archaeon]